MNISYAILVRDYGDGGDIEESISVHHEGWIIGQFERFSSDCGESWTAWHFNGDTDNFRHAGEFTKQHINITLQLLNKAWK